VSAPATRRIAGLFAAATTFAVPAFAQTAAEGYSIYQFGTFENGTPIGAPACATCHGPEPRNSSIPQIIIAAGDPSVLPTAWAMAPMNQYNYTALIDANGRQGLATYILYPPAGTQPYSLFAAQSLDFGDVVVGQTPAPKQMVLSNVGALALTGVAIQANPSATGVTETNDCPATLDPQQSCTVTVTFAPLAAGTANAAYVVSASNDANTTVGPDTFYVYATGVTSAPPPPPPPPAASSGGGGALGLEPLLLLLLPTLSRRRPASRTDR